MSKTNFKCMYLIDDILYKDMVSKNTNNEHNSSFVPQFQIPTLNKDLFKQGKVEIFEDVKSNKEGDMSEKTNKTNELQPVNSTETKKLNNDDVECKCMEPQDLHKGVDKISGSDVQYKGIEKMTGSDVQYKGIDKMTGSDVQYKGIDKMAGPDVQSVKISNNDKMSVPDVQSVKISNKSMQTDDENQSISKVPEDITSDESMKSESDDEGEWEELRKRYRKLRYGSDDDSSAENVRRGDKKKSNQVRSQRISSQGKKYKRVTKGKTTDAHKVKGSHKKYKQRIPDEVKTKSEQGPDKFLPMISQRQDNVQKQTRQRTTQTKAQALQNASVVFHCTICKSQFKNFVSLSRHMKNIHGEYFEDWNRENKRKNNDNFDMNKKFKADGRLKRNASTERADIKRLRGEYACMFCQSYFKTSAGLKRHTQNIHGVDTIRGKRKTNNTTEERYLKRQKTKYKVPVTYQNYF